MGFSNSTLVLLNDGKAKGVGQNYYGQLGNQSTIDIQSVAVDVALSNIKKIVAGRTHTFFILQDGTIKAVGRNVEGQLGLGNTQDQYVLQTVQISGVKDVACGNNHTIFLMEDGGVKVTGKNNLTQLGNNTTQNVSQIQKIALENVAKVSCGLEFTMFLMKDGTVKSVGQNVYGQLGKGVSSSSESVMVDVPISGVKDIICGGNHTIFQMNDGKLKGVGSNDYGQLGNSSYGAQLLIKDINISGVKQIECGNNHTMFLMEDGSVKGIGYSENGEIGSGVSKIVNPDLTIANVANVSRISCGGNHTIFLLNDGSVRSVGYNQFGQLGIGKATMSELSMQSSMFTSVKMLMNQSSSVKKFLFQQVDQLKTWLSGSWKNLAVPVTKELFLAEGVSSLTGIPTAQLTNSTKILKWSDDVATSKLVMTVPKTLYDASNKLYKGIGIVETATETLAFKPKSLIINADHTEAIFSFSLDDGATWYTVTSGEVKDISGMVGTKLKVRASLPTATSTLTALSYAWA